MRTERRQYLRASELEELRTLLSRETFRAVEELVPRHWIDLAGTVRGYFSDDDLLAISGEAGAHLQARLKAQSTHEISPAQVRLEWNAIVADFHTQNYWGYSLNRSRPPRSFSATIRELERFEDRLTEKRYPPVDRKTLALYIFLFVALLMCTYSAILFVFWRISQA